jgi:hypothetical protein
VASSSLPVSKIALPISGVSSWLFYPLLSFGLPPAISAVQRFRPVASKVLMTAVVPDADPQTPGGLVQGKLQNRLPR